LGGLPTYRSGRLCQIWRSGIAACCQGGYEADFFRNAAYALVPMGVRGWPMKTDAGGQSLALEFYQSPTRCARRFAAG